MFGGIGKFIIWGDKTQIYWCQITIIFYWEFRAIKDTLSNHYCHTMCVYVCLSITIISYYAVVCQYNQPFNNIVFCGKLLSLSHICMIELSFKYLFAIASPVYNTQSCCQFKISILIISFNDGMGSYKLQ